MKDIKKHGMSSEKASRIKKRGHNKEKIFASIINGEIIKGIKKQDVKDSYGKLFSIKGGSEIKGGEGRKGKWQIFLYKKSRFEEDDIPGKNIFIRILSCYPTNYIDYEGNKDSYKNMITSLMIDLKNYLLDKENLEKFLEKSFFDKNIDFFVIYDDEIFHIFDKQEVWSLFSDKLFLDNNKTSQKVVFKYSGNILAEIEIRTTNDGKYPSVLFNMLKRNSFQLLTDNITEFKNYKDGILKVYGKAVGKFHL